MDAPWRPDMSLGWSRSNCHVVSNCVCLSILLMQCCAVVQDYRRGECRGGQGVGVGQGPQYFGSRVRPGICVKYFLSFSLKKN